jgi:Leucine-rich repeat (LRR) protein
LCYLERIPESIGNLDSLKELDLYGNEIRTLPDSIENLQSLKKMNLVSNKLENGLICFNPYISSN